MIKTFYYRDPKIINHKAKHYKAFTADIKFNNIWISEIHNEKFTPLKGMMYGFSFFKSGAYKFISEDIPLNTHIDPIIKGSVEKSYRTFVYLTEWEHFKLRWSHKLTEFQRNKIQFILLIITALGVILSSVFSFMTYHQGKQPLKTIKVQKIKSQPVQQVNHKTTPSVFKKNSVNKK